MINKVTLTLLFLTLSFLSYSQTQSESLARAEKAYQANDFSNATDNFKNAFSVKESTNYFDYYYAALSAIQNHNQSLALQWLNKSIDKGLGKEKEELNYIKSQKEFEPLHSLDEWEDILVKLSKNQKNDETQKILAKEKWLSNIISKEEKPSSFDLNFQKVDSINFPYIVYFPKNYDSTKEYPLITFLHGGTGDEAFYQTYSNSNLKDEPIFTSADKVGAIVIYPIARKNFNWLTNEKSVEEIVTIVEKTINEYKIDKKNILIGGMSNGGRATFWFTQLDNSPFTGYYAFSGYPDVEYKEIDFTKIIDSKPFITINSKDDSIFPINDVLKIYDKQKKFAKGWELRVIDKGTHGFIYNQEVDGQNIVTKTISELIKR